MGVRPIYGNPKKEIEQVHLPRSLIIFVGFYLSALFLFFLISEIGSNKDMSDSKMIKAYHSLPHFIDDPKFKMYQIGTSYPSYPMKAIIFFKIPRNNW